MGTPIKLGVSAGTMEKLKAYLCGKDGANCVLVPGFHLSLGCACSGNGTQMGFCLINSVYCRRIVAKSVLLFPRNFCSAQNGSQLDIKVNIVRSECSCRRGCSKILNIE